MPDQHKIPTGIHASAKQKRTDPLRNDGAEDNSEEPVPAPAHDAGATTTRDTTETEAYSNAHPSPDAEHATNQTTDESLRHKRSHNRG